MTAEATQPSGRDPQVVESSTVGQVFPARPGFGVRLLDALAGLLSAGILLVGILLLFAALIAPSAVAAAGLGVADGPGWDRVIGHLMVGLCGELVVLLRRRWTMAVRVLADVMVVVAGLAVLWWGWSL